MPASTARSRARLATLALAAVLALGATPSAVASDRTAPAAAPAGLVTATGDTLTFTGRGWGHGRGMGQYGALGYAVDHGWSSGQILDHYYGGTTAGNAGNRQITVELTAQTGRPLVVIARDLWVNGQRLGAASLSATVRADGSVELRRGTTCADASTPVAGSFTAGAVEIGSGSQSSFDQLVRVCEASGERAYRGSLTVQRVNGSQMTFNKVASEDYLRGVVPRESPASWGSLGGGRGMQALQAQAVAARSYALSGTRPSGATTCDTTACQVYGGAAFQAWSQPQTILDAAASNQAIDATSGVVRLTRSGAIARTEFSSSTGGYTAGGTFPAVPDDGDGTASNPNRTWTKSVPVATASAALGVGTVRSIAVTQRNGLGADGGRVLGVSVIGTSGSRTMTGDQMRSALGLKSDWFSVSWTSPSEAASVVTALYADLLGRGPDATGLSTWTDALLQGRSQSELVATLTRSDEYINIRVRQAYREVLGREPEPAGAQSWLVSIRAAGGATVDDVQRRFYGSDEYFVVSGGTDTGYVQRLYQTMLGREASAADLAEWVPRMGSAAGRESVVNGIWFSMEAAQRRAGAYYRVFLGREPDGPGVLNWGTVLLQQGEGAVRTGIAGSQEYHDRALVRFP